MVSEIVDFGSEFDVDRVMQKTSEILAVVGPSATGKTAFALQLARAYPGTALINADAFSMYRQMNIGTSKPSAQDLAGIDHYLFNVLDPPAEASVALYRNQVIGLIDDLLTANRKILLVGGSGLYVRAALDDLDFPPTDATLRQQLKAELSARGASVIYQKLQQIDPATAQRLQPQNTRRVIRALEVAMLTGQSFTPELPPPEYRRPTQQIAFSVPRATLFLNIEQRTRRMLDQGLIDETAALLDTFGPTARKAIGYAETIAYLNGAINRQQLEDLINLHTRQLVKRQLTWFGKDARIRWLKP